MSRFVSNRSCELCDKTEVGLAEMKVGSTKHYLCYPCMAEFANDILEFAYENLTKHTGYFGKIYFTDGEESEEE